MVHRGTTRESRGVRQRERSTVEAKRRRHRNKKRVWQRCVKRLVAARAAFESMETGALHAGRPNTVSA